MRVESDIQRSVWPAARSPLQEHSVLRSNSFEETRAFLRGKALDLQPRGPRSLSNGFGASIAAAYLPRMYVAYMHYGSAVRMTAQAPLEAGYAVHLPLAGWTTLDRGGEAVECGSGGALVVSPCNHLSLTTGAGCRRLLLAINPEALVDHLATLLGDAPKDRLVFEPAVDATQARGRRLANAVRYAAGEFEFKDSLEGNDVMLTQFEEFIMTLLLMSRPHNYSDALAMECSGARPRDVKRAIDYIQANLGAAISLADLVATSGVPGRTLCQHFQDFVGTSPLGYVKKARYERVRQELIGMNGERTVTEIAGHWGFNHMGRFAAEYRSRFGELPSVTARRRRPTK